MSKERTPELMDNLLGGVPRPKRQAEERPALSSTGRDRKLKLTSVRLPGDWMDTLSAYFSGKGLDLSSGLRLWIGERMEQEGLK